MIQKRSTALDRSVEIFYRRAYIGFTDSYGIYRGVTISKKDVKNQESIQSQTTPGKPVYFFSEDIGDTE